MHFPSQFFNVISCLMSQKIFSKSHGIQYVSHYYRFLIILTSASAVAQLKPNSLRDTKNTVNGWKCHEHMPTFTHMQTMTVKLCFWLFNSECLSLMQKSADWYGLWKTRECKTRFNWKRLMQNWDDRSLCSWSIRWMCSLRRSNVENHNVSIAVTTWQSLIAGNTRIHTSICARLN